MERVYLAYNSKSHHERKSRLELKQEREEETLEHCGMLALAPLPFFKPYGKPGDGAAHSGPSDINQDDVEVIQWRLPLIRWL